MLSRYMLTALLLVGASIAASSNVLDGFLQVSSGLARAQANANVYVNKLISRASSVTSVSNAVYFITTKTYLTNSSAGYDGLLDLSVATSMIIMSAGPVPRAISIQSSLTLTSSVSSLSSQAHAVVFPAAVEYTEANGVDGFQYGQDTVVQTIPFVQSGVSGALALTKSMSVSTEIWPAGSNSTGNATVHVASYCPTGGLCISFRLSGSTYIRNGSTYLPDSAKIDLQVNTASFKNTSRLALLSSFVSTSDILPLADFHQAVNGVLQAAQKSGALAVCTPDFVGFINSSSGVTVSNGNASNFNTTLTSGYLNYARTAVLVSSSGNTSVDVNAQVIFNASLSSLVHSALDSVSYSLDYLLNPLISAGNFQYIVFSFLAPINGASSIVWDPEIGTTAVTQANYVVTRSGTSSTGTAGSLSSGAIAGVVIGVLAVGGIVGFLGYKARANKPTSTLLK